MRTLILIALAAPGCQKSAAPPAAAPVPPRASGDEAPTRLPSVVVRPSVAAPEVAAGRYTRSACGAVRDGGSGLEWYLGPDETWAYGQAAAWAAGLGACGGGWSLPTAQHVRTLFDRRLTAGQGYRVRNQRFPAHIDPVFSGIGEGSWVWLQNGGRRGCCTAYNLNQNTPTQVSPEVYEGYTVRTFAVRRSAAPRP